VLALVQGLGKTPIGWQEIFDNHLNLTARTIVNVWKYHNAPCTGEGGAGAGAGSAAQTWQGELASVTAAGYLALLSSPWYLNIVQYAPDWEEFYLVEPLNFTGSPAQQALVIGGELSVWGEYVDATNLLSRTFPRGSAVAERLWSAASVRDAAGAALRINDQRCRMLARGITAGPLLPSSCPAEAEIAYSPPFSLS
jgi:hexosaminidase